MRLTRSVTRIVQISDSHLSPSAPFAGTNWDAVVEEVGTIGADLVVHTGDISLDGANDEADLIHAREQLDRLQVPWLAIPGNHDIGDCGGPQAVDARRRARYRGVFDHDSWSVALGGWQLVGVDIQTLVGDDDPAHELREWLTVELRTTTPTALFLHRPLRPLAIGEADTPTRYVTEPARSWLTALCEAGSVRLIGSGHVHQWRSVPSADASHVWAPSTWAVLPEWEQPTIGTKVPGIVVHDLGPDGLVASDVSRPDGLIHVTVGQDFASPYHA